IMLHRRLWNDLEWNLNYNLTLNDTSVIKPTIWLLLGSKAVTGSLYQKFGMALEHRPWILYNPQAANVIENCKTSQGNSNLPIKLPDNIHLQILSIPGWFYSSDYTESFQDAGKAHDTVADFHRVLLRLQHLYETEEDPILSKPVTVNVQSLLKGMGTLTFMEERSLTGTWDLQALKRWEWKSKQRKITSRSRLNGQ
ncbi:hypothetical protein GDO86_009769, partial [Hymenochirus boettgeri]